MDSTAARWRSYFITQQQTEIRTLSAEFPTRAVVVDPLHLHGTDEQLAQAVFANPSQTLREGRAVVRELTEAAAPVQLQLKNNPQQFQRRTAAHSHLAA